MNNQNEINHATRKRYKELGEAALINAKSIPRKAIFIPQGVTGEILTGTPVIHGGMNTKRKKRVDHEAVMARLNEGAKQSQVAKEFKITRQSVIYIQNKFKNEKTL